MCLSMEMQVMLSLSVQWAVPFQWNAVTRNMCIVGPVSFPLVSSHVMTNPPPHIQELWPVANMYFLLSKHVSVPFLDSRVADPVGVGSGTIRMRKKTFRIRPKSDRIRIWNPATRIHWLQKRLNRLLLTVYSSVNSLSLAYRSFLPRTLQHNGWKNGNLYNFNTKIVTSIWKICLILTFSCKLLGRIKNLIYCTVYSVQCTRHTTSSSREILFLTYWSVFRKIFLNLKRRSKGDFILCNCS